MKVKPAYIVNSISEQHRIMSLPKPLHPLMSVFHLEDSMHRAEEFAQKFALNFYCVSLKKGFKGKFKYGQRYYDFDEGMVSFIAPHQSLENLSEEEYELSGICLSFHPDFIRNYPLAKKIKEYGFFSYATNEALHLSEKEEKMIETILRNIEAEYQSAIDGFSQDVMIAHIDLLLTYCNRFYNRQFLTRKAVHHDLLDKMELLLNEHFDAHKEILPTVEFLASKLNVSAGYLSDMLRSLTGQTAQQHIHLHLIEKAKELLANTHLSVGEIAYQFGFEYPQSFNKLFKNKTGVTPLQYRQSFN
ncbi:HTH-type transcriptional activator Btr [compost metagenome]